MSARFAMNDHKVLWLESWVHGNDPAGTPISSITLKALVPTFTEGRCWELALHIHETRGWRLFDVCEMHAVVMIPGTRKYLDITGTHTAGNLLKKWKWFHGTELLEIHEGRPYFHDWGFGDCPLNSAALEVVTRKLLKREGLSDYGKNRLRGPIRSFPVSVGVRVPR